MAKFNGGFGGMGNMQQLMKQAQKMQEDMKRAQDELEELVVEGSASGLVTVRLNGKKEFLSIEIKPAACDPDDVEMLEDLIRAAMNDAKVKADEEYNKRMGAFAQLGL